MLRRSNPSIRLILVYMAVLITLINSSSYSQVYQINDTEMHFRSFWEIYSDNRLSTSASGRGYTGIANLNEISGVILNPASLEVEEKFQFHFEYIYKNSVPWLKGLASDIYLKQLHPTMLVGSSLKINNSFQTGIVFYTNNSYKLDLGKSYFYDEYGNLVDSFNSYDDLRISSFLIPIRFKYSDLIRLGINVIYSMYSLKEVLRVAGEAGIPGYTAIGKANFDQFIVKFGILILPDKNFSIGLTFLPQTKEIITVKWNFGQQDKFKPNVFPAKVGVGFQYRLTNFPISFYLDYNYSDNSKEKILVDRHDIHFGVEYPLINTFSVRGGIFTQWDYRSGDTQRLDRIGEYDQIFTTFGASYHPRFFTIDLSIIDSHLLSRGKIKQTYISSGLTYNF